MKKVMTLLILILLFSITNSYALYVDVSNNNGNNLISTVFYDDGVGAFDANDKKNLRTGNFKLDFKNSEKETYYSTYGFCIELPESYGSGIATINAISSDKFKKAAWVLDNYWTSFDQLIVNAGIQLAVWDIIYNPVADTEFFVVAGDQFAPILPDATGLDQYSFYQGIMTNLVDSYSNDFDASDYRTIYMDGNQDMITTNPVPEPATMLLFGIGLLGMAGIGRKKTA
jgi:hypothetical protein